MSATLRATLPDRRGAIILPQQRFTDEEGVEAGGAKTVDIRSRLDSTFRHAECAVRNLPRQTLRRAEVDSEIAQIAVVDADDASASADGAGQLRFIVYFDQRIATKGIETGDEGADLRGIEERCQQQDRAGAGGDTADDL